MPDVGDSYPAVLLVDPFDGTTQVALAAIRPDGQVLARTPQTSDGGNTWSASVDLDLAGTWLLKWTVTGTGARTLREEIPVGPGPSTDLDGRIYASTTDLALFLQDAPPLGAAKLLADASRKMDQILLTAVYATDALGMPSDPVQAQAVAEATCAVVEWWLETGDVLGAGGDWTSASAGGVSISRAPGGTLLVGGQSVPWKAWNALTAARILPGVVYQR